MLSWVARLTNNKQTSLPWVLSRHNNKSQNFGRRFHKKYSNKFCLCEWSWKNEHQYWKIRGLRWSTKKQPYRCWKNESAKWRKRPMTQFSNMLGGSEASQGVIGKSTTFKIPIFDGTSPWELHHKLVGNMLKICWQHAGNIENILKTCQQNVGNLLTTYWQLVSNRLETYWQHIWN